MKNPKREKKDCYSKPSSIIDWNLKDVGVLKAVGEATLQFVRLEIGDVHPLRQMYCSSWTVLAFANII